MKVESRRAMVVEEVAAQGDFFLHKLARAAEPREAVCLVLSRRAFEVGDKVNVTVALDDGVEVRR